MHQFEGMHESLRKMLEKISQQLRDLAPPGLHPAPSLPAPDSDVQRMETSLLSIYHKMERGMRKLVELLNELPDISNEPNLVQAIGDMITIASVVIKQVKPALQMMAKGEPLQEILGISRLSLQSLYKLSRYLYEHQHYEEASGAFYLLALINPSYHIFWIGLGNCEYFLRRYQEALLAYTFAAQTNPRDPSCQLLIAKCQMALGNYAAATAYLSLAELSVVHTPASENVKKQVEALRNDLERYQP